MFHFNSMEPQRAANDNPNSDSNSSAVYRCKVCGMECMTRQSLGGHSNVHRGERVRQQRQAVEAVRRRFRYIPYDDGHVWATDDNSTYYQMRLLHPPLAYSIQHERLSVQPPKLRMASAPQRTKMPLMEEEGLVFTRNNVDNEGVKELDLTLRL